MTNLPPLPQEPSQGQTPPANLSGGAACDPRVQGSPGAAAPPMPQPWWMQPPPQKKCPGRRFLKGLGILLFFASVMLNVSLLAAVALSKGAGLQSVTVSEGASDQIVAVYTVEGTIGEETAAEFRLLHRQVQTDANIKAVVLRVNSPGGTVAASDEIYHMVKEIQDTLKKPVVVSMGGVAASGGYYISAPAQMIVAEPTTITGSIGVIAVWPVLKDFFDSHGVKVMTIRSRQAVGNKATENYWEIPSERTRKDVEDMLTTMHERFAKVVKEGRPKLVTSKVTVSVKDGGEMTDVEETKPLNGTVYLADEAMKLGLVDQIGYLSDAVKEAAKMAKLSSPKEVHYAKSVSFREMMGVSQSAPLVDPKTLDKLMTPQIMMLWKVD
jgi:protease-4